MNIQVIEHQRIHISKNRDAQKKTITREDAAYLRLIEEKNNYQIFKWGRDYISPQQWIGIISTPKVSIEILPKITDEENYDFIKEKLIHMLQVCYDIPLRKNVDARITYGKQGFLDILVAIFLRELEKQIKSGLIRTYQKITKNLPAIKGSIDLTKHINKNMIASNRFVCEFSSLTNDNLLNQTIKYTLTLLNNLVIHQSNKLNIRKLLSYFDTVSLRMIKPGDLKNIHFNRNSSRYKEVIEYCRLFIEGNSLQLKSGEVKVSLMLFDMNKLFEKYIYRSYNKVFRGKVSYQYSKSYLLKTSNDQKKVQLQPDMLIHKDDTERVIIDTKWKNVNFAEEKDLYQMNAYLTIIPDIREGILLYPKSQKNDKMVGSYTFLHPDREVTLKIRTVDLTLTGDNPAFFAYLRNLLD
jgi:5-methylcytosine-specific restriction enzyme subunit McrC